VQKQDESEILYGRGPVRELLRARRQVECLMIQKGLDGALIGGLIALAREQGVPVKQVDVRKLDELSLGKVHQGVAAIVPAARYAELEDILARSKESPAFIVIADKIEDPHNLGAIIRTAEAAGVHGIVIPKRRSVGLSPAVAKTSAGALEHIPVARAGNIPSLIEDLKKRGIWIYGADMDGKPYDQVDFSGPAALVLGSEGDGLGRLVRERCDMLVSLPMRGAMSSLNVSVAAGILLYEMARGRDSAPAPR